jgi:ribosomal protein S6
MNASDEEKNLYELAYLLPAAQEGSAAATQEILDKAKHIIEEQGGVINQEQAPVHRRLAYPVLKQREALFGFLRFTMLGESIQNLTKSLKLESKLMRFVIVRVMPKQLQEEQQAQTRIRPVSPVTPTYTPKPKEVMPEIKPEEFEKKLEEILKE